MCQQMFERIDCDSEVNSTEGFLGSIPVVTRSKDGKLLVGDSMFTYPIRELAEPRLVVLRFMQISKLTGHTNFNSLCSLLVVVWRLWLSKEFAVVEKGLK